ALWERYTRLIVRKSAVLPTLVLGYDDVVDDVSSCLGTLQAYLGNHGIPTTPAPDDGRMAVSTVDGSLRHSDSRRLRRAEDPTYASALAMYEALDALRGTTLRSELSLGPEEVWVSRALDEWGPERQPQWRDPEI